MAQDKNLIQMLEGNKSFGAQVLFSKATFAVNEGEHLGVIGPNGAGKSTLFKILVAQQDLDSGKIVRSQDLRIGYLSQHDDWLGARTGNEFILKNALVPPWQAKSSGRDLQMTEDLLDAPIESLSGGYRMRIKLLGLLAQDPNLILLDEPTNYLDLETTLLFERFLQNYNRAFLLISHDRELLRRTTDHTLEVESGDIVKYSGNLDDYFEQKELWRTQEQARVLSQAAKKKSILDFVNRFGAKATKAKQAQSRLKILEKMESIEVKNLPTQAKIKIPEPPNVGKTILKLENACFGYNSKNVLAGVHLEIKRGDHIGVVGLNGAGKSTLLKGLSGQLRPLGGHREMGSQVEFGIFNQHVAENLDATKSVLETFRESASLEVTDQEIRDLAGALLFAGPHVEKKVNVLSGGEKSRVALGKILLRKVSCLLLDEPTNHLDFQTVEALIQALTQFKGTLITVSHDRGFLNRVSTKILEVNNGQVQLYPGSYQDYVWSLQQKVLAANDSQDKTKEPIKALDLSQKWNQQPKEKSAKAREKKITELEAKIIELEQVVQSLNNEISRAPPSTDLREKISKLVAASEALKEAELQWMELLASNT